tara:strand:- start:2212 stop:2868 length:657 start_codon:yes stop_codon:yes gene_type:complete
MIRDVISNNGYVISALISLSIIIIAKKIHGRRFSDLIRVFSNSNYFRIYLKEHRVFDSFDLLLFLNFCINCSAYSFIIYCSLINLIEINVRTFLTIFLAIVLFLLIKLLTRLFIGYVFDIYDTISILTFQQISTINFIGITLLPVNLMLAFGLNYQIEWLIISISFMIIIAISGMLKTIQTNLSLVLSNFLYFILYICTLEIGPYIIIYYQLKDYNLL